MDNFPQNDVHFPFNTMAYPDTKCVLDIQLNHLHVLFHLNFTGHICSYTVSHTGKKNLAEVKQYPGDYSASQWESLD